VKETFAPIRPLPERLAEDEAADYAEDGGLGRIAFDPIPTLIARLSADEPRERALAAEILGKRGAQARDAAPALRRALKDSDRRVRANAALALGDIGVSGRGVRSDLKRAAKDGSEDVRDSALLALQRIDDRR
jgi:HEAT repeat protein